MKKLAPTPSEFELLFFAVDELLVRTAVNAGIDGIIVDWENQGKKLRQKNFDTQINHNTYEDLCRVRRLVPPGKLICRINGFQGDETLREADRAIHGGADEIFLPMVTSPEQVVAMLMHCGDTVAVSILIETTAALSHLNALSRLPLKRVYVGLNDLHIQQGTPNIFYPLMNNTVATVRSSFDLPLGVGGVTYPQSGHPIASSFLIREYARLCINFSFLRRTFTHDCRRYEMDFIIQAIKEAYRQARQRTSTEEEADFLEFREQVERWVTNPYQV